MILPAMFCLTACDSSKETAKVVGISVELASGSSYALNDGEINIEYGEKATICDSDFVVTATLDNGKTKTIEIKSDSNKNGFTFTSTIPSDDVTPIGEYTLTLGHENVAETEYITIKVNVVKKVVDIDALNLIWVDESNPIVYNGQYQTVEITNLPDYLEATYYNNSEMSPSTYFATATIDIKEDYTDRYVLENPETPISHKWTIAKGTIAVPDVNNKLLTYTYDNTEKTASFSTEMNEYLADNDISYTITGSDKATNAGDYEVTILFTYVGEDKDCYELQGEQNDQIGSISTLWSIEKVSIDVSNVSLKVKGGDSYTDAFTYSGNENSVVFDLSSLKNETNTIYDFVGDSACPLESSTILPTTGSRIVYPVSSGILSATNAGEYTTTITFTIHNDFLQNYKFSNTTENSVTVTKTWEISKTNLTLAVNNKTNTNALTYGDTVSYSASDVVATGFVGGETLESLDSLSFVYSTSADGEFSTTVPRNAGRYFVKVNTFSLDNYNITFTVGELEIKKATLTVTPENKTFTYGGSGTGNVTIEGYKYDDENALQQQIDYALTIEVGTIVDEVFEVYNGKMVVGEYVYKVSGLDNLANYTPNYVYGTMTITPSPLSITLNEKTGNNALTYGDTLSYSASDVFVSGLNYYESLESLGEITVVYSKSQTGTFDVTPKNAGTYYAKVGEFEYNQSNRNYNITYNVSQLEIKKAVITVEIPNEQWEYGSISGIGLKMTGFKYGESNVYREENYIYIRKDVKYYNSAEQDVRPDGSYLPVGTYRYSPNCSSSNYTFEYVNEILGNLVVVPKNIEISASLENPLEYGDELLSSNVKYSYYSIKIGESSGELTYTTNYTQGSPAGEYTITACGLVHSSNYIVTYSPTTFTVAPKSITIMPTAQKMVYGDSVTLGASNIESITSWVDDADSSVLDSNISFEYQISESQGFSTSVPINVGNYKYRVKPFTSSNKNYTFTFAEADYVIERRPIKVTIGNATAEYGSDFSELDIPVSYGGVVYYDKNENCYVDRSLAFNPAPEGQEDTLKENIIAINTTFAYDDDASLFASIEVFKFGKFLNDEFEPYDKDSSNWSNVSIFLAIDRPSEGPDLTNAVDNYIIIANNGWLTVTKNS